MGTVLFLVALFLAWIVVAYRAHAWTVFGFGLLMSVVTGVLVHGVWQVKEIYANQSSKRVISQVIDRTEAGDEQAIEAMRATLAEPPWSDDGTYLQRLSQVLENGAVGEQQTSSDHSESDEKGLRKTSSSKRSELSLTDGEETVLETVDTYYRNGKQILIVITREYDRPEEHFITLNQKVIWGGRMIAVIHDRKGLTFSCFTPGQDVDISMQKKENGEESLILMSRTADHLLEVFEFHEGVMVPISDSRLARAQGFEDEVDSLFEDIEDGKSAEDIMQKMQAEKRRLQRKNK